VKNDLPAPSVLTSWARVIVRTLQARGVDPRPLVREAGLDPAAFEDPEARFPITATGALWRRAAEATGDPAFGLDASRFVTQTTFHALGYAVAASETLREAFERYVRYGRLVSDAAELSLAEDGARVRLSFTPRAGGPQAAAEAMDAMLSMITRGTNALAGRSLRPLAVQLRRPEPSVSSPWPRVFQAPVSFGHACDALEYARVDVDAKLPAGNVVLARANEEVVARYLARFDEANVAGRVQALLVERLSSGEPDPEAIARALGMSLRSLQRRLEDDGTSFKEVLAVTRRELACAYLKGSRTSVTEVTFLLGFADTSSFARAFRRWTGASPSEWRERSLHG
jgi:AraC-like DNA-binding protein